MRLRRKKPQRLNALTNSLMRTLEEIEVERRGLPKEHNNAEWNTKTRHSKNVQSQLTTNCHAKRTSKKVKNAHIPERPTYTFRIAALPKDIQKT